MRLFIAMDLPNEVKDVLWDITKKIKGAKITWVPKKNVHLTLRFLGEVDQSALQTLKKRIRISASKLTLSIGDIGFFPDEICPRVIWIAIKPEKAIVALAQKIDAELLDLFSSEQKFQAHITIGRIKQVRDKELFQRSVDELNIRKLSFVVESFQLMKSELRSTGPIYQVIDDVPLS